MRCGRHYYTRPASGAGRRRPYNIYFYTIKGESRTFITGWSPPHGLAHAASASCRGLWGCVREPRRRPQGAILCVFGPNCQSVCLSVGGHPRTKYNIYMCIIFFVRSSEFGRGGVRGFAFALHLRDWRRGGALGARLGLSLGAEAQRRLERVREREQHAQQWRERKRR